ncbi:MAG TPA: glycosyltransferase family 4 protein [Solirubrobacterales bacterium]|nr:glycosyltransferase family 4 protein [Solirubrobacterales bacterium]
MRVLIFHGYLLRGTGSNVYNASLAQALAGQGHDVHLLCQDRRAAELDWVDAVGDWDGGRLQVKGIRDAGRAGSVTVYRPDIGGLLPVYVLDRYEGFEVKTFPDLSDAELDRYLDANVAAVRDVVAAAGHPQAALANHLIMGPAILSRAGLRFAIKVHGSDISYTVRPHPERFVPYAREGTNVAAGILAGSSYTARALFETVPDPSLSDRTRLGPPGVDIHRFRPHPEEESLRDLDSLAERLAGEEPEEGGEDDSFGRDGPEIAAALQAWGQGDQRVLFVGKLLISKGVDLLAAAWPLVHRARTAAGALAPRILFIGFGAFEEGLRILIDALERGDLEAARDVAARGRGLEGAAQPNAPLPILSGFLADPPEGYTDAARDAAGSMLIGGRLEHDEVADVMPAAHTFTMPSTWPEAFGMVPAESAACGVPPTAADHSGMREVAQVLAEAVPDDLGRLLSFPVGPGAVGELAERVEGWLSLEPDRRREAGLAFARRVDELWSWDGVARTVLAASAGELSDLPRVTG